MPSSVTASIPPAGLPNTDFGTGFYTATNRDQAMDWAKRQSLTTPAISPLVLKLTIDQ